MSRQTDEEKIAALMRVYRRAMWEAMFPLWARVAVAIVAVGALLRIGWGVPDAIDRMVRETAYAIEEATK